MTEWKKLLPTPSPETRPFWEACRRGQLLLQRCRACGLHQFPPRAICSHCWGKDVEWVTSSGKGTVWTFTVTHQNRSPGFAEEVPYVLAYVELEGGARMMTNIIECRPQDVRIGMPVEAVFVKATEEISVPYFRPVR